MDRRLKIMTIALSVSCVVIVGCSAHRLVASFVYGIKIGIKAGIENIETGKAPVMSSAGFFSLSLKPEKGYYTFPTTFRNQLDRKPMNAEVLTMLVELNEASDGLSKTTLAADYGSSFLSLFVILMMVFIPIQTFRILRSMTRDRIFDPSNISKLRLIGYAILAFYFTSIAFSFLHYSVASNLVEVDGYKLHMDWGNTTLVILGFVILMFAEMLKVAVAMKEEQELTV